MVTEGTEPTLDAAGTILDAAGAARRTLSARERGEAVVCLLVIDGPSEGLRRVVEDSGTAFGALGSEELNRAADALARELLEGGPIEEERPRDAGVHRVRIDPHAETSPREVEFYVELYRAPETLVIVGAGHLALPLTRVGALLGYRVFVLDDRPDFALAERFPEAERVLRVDFQEPFRDVRIGAASHVLLVTRGHRYDYECLRRLLVLPRPPGYIGMIGSRRRVRATFHQLLEEGVPIDQMGRIRAPVGLDLGGETPEEIAVEVAAELVLLRRGGTGRPLIEVEGVARRFFGKADSNDGPADPPAARVEEEES